MCLEQLVVHLRRRTLAVAYGLRDGKNSFTDAYLHACHVLLGDDHLFCFVFEDFAGLNTTTDSPSDAHKWLCGLSTA